jgi:CRP-like cAMP-binding protein
MSTESPLERMVAKLGRWTALDDEDRAAIRGLPHRLRTVEAGQYIIREFDRAENSCLLRSGFAWRHKMVGNGGRQVLSIHMAGDIIDLHNSLLLTADHSIQALTPGEIALIPRAAIQALAADRPAVGMAMWLDTLIDGSIFREWIANVGRRDSRTRTAHVLCEFALRQEDAGLGKRGAYELPMTQEQLADVLGLTAVHVNRTLKSLEADGLIARDKRAITIASWEDLRTAGDFNPSYLHLDLAEEGS